MLKITGLAFNGSICLRMSATIHLLPLYAFMAYSVRKLHNRGILQLVTC